MHYKFFREIEVTWGEIPSYSELLEHFSALGLRRAENPMRWLTDSGLVTVDEVLRESNSEWRRIEQLLAEVGEPWPRSLMSAYFEMLSSRIKQEKLTVRSARLALRAAVSFLVSCKLAPSVLPAQKKLEAYWRSSPGSVAAVTGFVSFLNKNYGLKLDPRPNSKWLKKVKNSKAENELIEILHEHPRGSLFESRWIRKAVVFFHGRVIAREALHYSAFTHEGVAGFEVELEGERLWVPSAESYGVVS